MRTPVAAFDASRNLRGKPFRSLCYAPHVQLSFSPNGDVSACCISRSHVLGNVQTDALDDIWKGPRIEAFREMLRDYAFPSGCESCRWSLEAENFVDHPIRYFDDVPIAEGGEWPSRLEFALSNTCNLGCVMCNGEFSSVLRAKEGLPPLPRAYGESFFSDLARYLPHAKSLTFLGGEPFLQPEAFRIWDMLIDRNLGIPCHVTTNGSIYDRRVERALHHLPFDIAVSVDGVTKETIESIRVNVKYETLMENIERFNGYARGRADRFPALRRPRLQLNYCVMRQNWREVGDFFLFAEELGCAVWKVFVTNPPGCSLFTLPPGELEPVVSALEVRSEEMNERLTLNRDVWFAMVEEARNHLGQKPVSLLDRVTLETGDFSGAPRKGTPEKLVRAWRLNARGHYEEAAREVESIPEDDTYCYQARCALAEFRIGLGDYDGSERALDHALTFSDRRPEAYLIRAWLNVTRGDMGVALEAARQAAAAGARLREVESRFVDDVLVQRLMRYQTLAAALEARWTPRPPV
jgi:radical SAM protein with 4Fe4S-binding SPASM domain